MIRQYPLDLRWPPHQRLDAFWPGANLAALQAVDAAARGGGAWLYLDGVAGAGKSHLLIGACRAALDAGRPARYVGLLAVQPPRGDALAEIAPEPRGLIAIDDVQALAGDRDAERALFALFNRARSAGAQVLFAATAPPAGLHLTLPDLVSRLSSCTRCALRALDDAGRRAMLRLLAQRVGLQLDEDVLDWWFARQPRDPASLVALLQRADRASLAAQRRITIPLLRELLHPAQA